MAKKYKAAMVVIGNEILSGRTKDENINYVANKLVERGVSLTEVRIIPDDESIIIKTINELRRAFDYVFTSGGIGPTHDDITSLSVAKAFGIELELDQNIYELLQNEYKDGDFTDASVKMAMLPEGVGIIPNPLSAAPGFILENVYVMAGVPVIMHAMMDYVADTLKGGEIIISRTVSCPLSESRIAAELEEIQLCFPDVEIGSYPYFNNSEKGSCIVLSSSNEQSLNKAEARVLKMVKDHDK